MKWGYKDLEIDYAFDIPAAEYCERVAQVRAHMLEEGIELGIAWGTQLFPGDIIYMSGFDINLEVGAMILLTQEELYLLTGPESYPAAKVDIKLGIPFGTADLGCPGVDYERTPGVTTVRECIDKILQGEQPKKAAVLTFPDFMTTLAYDAVRNALPAFTELVYATDILYKLRLNKSPAEQKLMTYAAQIATEGMKAVLNHGQAGMMEVEWGAPACARMRELGAHALTFDPLVQSGERIDTSIGKTYNKIVQAGEIVSLGIGCRYKHYAGHLCRSTLAGKGSTDQIAFLSMGAEACAAAGKTVIYDTPMANMDKASHDVFVKHGYAEYDTYSCGHGTGFTDGVGEGSATQKSEGLWPKNIVMMADVSLSGVSHGLHGFRFEDAFLIDNDGNTQVMTEGLPLHVW